MATAEILIRPAATADVYALAATLRPGDRAEIEAIGREPRAVLRASFRASLTPPRVAVLREDGRPFGMDGQIAAMWGLGGDILSDSGTPWLMTGTAADRVSPLRFFRIAQAELAIMLHVKPCLENYVAADYAKAIGLLRLLGFGLDEAIPVGRKRAPFRRFWIERANP